MGLASSGLWPGSNIGARTLFALSCEDVVCGEVDMELAIVTIVLIVAASQIPGDYHIKFFH
jgi:hypothetical protein